MTATLLTAVLAEPFPDGIGSVSSASFVGVTTFLLVAIGVAQPVQAVGVSP